MVKPRSTEICPKCKEPGFETWLPKGTKYVVHSPETTIFKGNYKKQDYSDETVQKGNRDLSSIPLKNYGIQSKRYLRRYFIHYSNEERKKCYVDNLPRNRREGSEILSELANLWGNVDNLMRLVKANPPTAKDDRMIAGWVNEFLTTDWIKKIAEESLKHGIDLNDVLSAKEKASKLSLDILFDILWYNPLWRANTYYYCKYVALKQDEKVKFIKKKLSEEYR